MTSINWYALLSSAIYAMKRAYCSYSGLPVGSAGLSQDGRIVRRGNV